MIEGRQAGEQIFAFDRVRQGPNKEVGLDIGLYHVCCKTWPRVTQSVALDAHLALQSSGYPGCLKGLACNQAA